MKQASDSLNLCGKFLLAMPGMGDPRFEHAVIFVCAHSPEGSLGLIVNRPMADLKAADVLQQLNVRHPGAAGDIRVQFGGPVEHGRGFVLHSGDYAATQSTMQVDDRFAMTATLDILEAIAKGTGPSAAILLLGYSGWGPGQLEQEIAQNAWLTCDALPEIVFGDDPTVKWTAALKTMGIDPLTLSASAGRA